MKILGRIRQLDLDARTGRFRANSGDDIHFGYRQEAKPFVVTGFHHYADVAIHGEYEEGGLFVVEDVTR